MIEPTPQLLEKLDDHLNRWVPVTEALPPQRLPVLVAVRGDNTPAYAWLKFAAGDISCPFFVCPQTGALEGRGYKGAKEDITHWYAPMAAGLPWAPTEEMCAAPWGLDQGWVLNDNLSQLADPCPLCDTRQCYWWTRGPRVAGFKPESYCNEPAVDWRARALAAKASR